MKNKVLRKIFIASSLSLTATVFATDLEWNGTFNDGTRDYGVRYEKAEVWSPSQVPTLSDNISFTTVGDSKLTTIISGGATVNAINMSYTFTGKQNSDSGNSDFDSLMVFGSNAYLKLHGNQTFNVTKDASLTSSVWLRAIGYGTSGVTVGGDFIINSDSDVIFRIDQAWANAGQQFGYYINGDAKSIGANSNLSLALSNYNFTVNRTTNLNAGTLNLAERSTTIMSAARMVSLGGLNGRDAKMLITKSGESIVADTNLTFTNNVNAAYNGTFMASAVNTKTLNITMLGETNARQILRIKSGTDTKWTRQTKESIDIANDGFKSVTVESGRLDIGFENGKSVGALSIYGGKFSTIGMTTEVGRVAADSLDWNGGIVCVDIISSTLADRIDISGDLTLSGAVIELTANGTDISAWLSETSDPLEYTIMTFSGNSGVSEEDIGNIVLNSIDGANAELFAIKTDADITGIGLRLTQVPEPAEVAVLFGALALLAAFIRKHK